MLKDRQDLQNVLSAENTKVHNRSAQRCTESGGGAGRQPVRLRKDAQETGNSDKVTSSQRAELRDSDGEVILYCLNVTYACTIFFSKINKEKTTRDNPRTHRASG